MKGQRVGYIRVSSVDQNEARQLKGVELNRTFLDKLSGKSTERPQLNEMLQYVREKGTPLLSTVLIDSRVILQSYLASSRD